MLSLIGGCGVPVPVTFTFPVIIDHEHTIQDDGDNLQTQGHDGELEPHVGGVRRHPETNSGYLSQSDTDTLTHSHSASLSVPICLFF